MKLLLITLSILAITTTTSNLTNFILNTSLQRVQLLDNKTQQNTIYIDKDGKQVSTSEVDLSNINSKEVIQIGFFQNWEKEVQVVKMPRTIEKVPDQLPSEITTLKNMFMDARSFNQDISKWNTSNVVDMSYMFAGASSFNQNLSWNIIKVRDMSAMFYGASLFNGNITNLIYDNNVTNMNDMFRNCSSFNQDISKWNVNDVTNMRCMFAGAALFNQDIGKWDTSKVTDMGYMFYKASLFNQDLSGWNVNEVLWHGWFAKNSGFENDPNKWPKFKS